MGESWDRLVRADSFIVYRITTTNMEAWLGLAPKRRLEKPDQSMMAVEAAGAKEDQAVGPEDDIEDAGNIEEVEQAMAQLLHHYQLTDTRDENSDYDSGLEEEVSCNSDDDDVFHPE